MTLFSHAQDAAVKAELAPTRTLRVGLIEAPTAGLIFVRRLEDGTPEGVTADLSTDLAQKVGLPHAVTLFPNSGAAAAALQAKAIDVSFMPVDAARRQVLDFGPGYYDLESTYLVSGASGITDVSEVDRPGLRVLAIDGTTTFRASARTLSHTQPVARPSVAEAVDRMRSGLADAFALSRDTLRPIVEQVPASRIVSGGFQQTQVAVAVPRGRPGALAYVTAWLDRAKRTGSSAGSSTTAASTATRSRHDRPAQGLGLRAAPRCLEASRLLRRFVDRLALLISVSDLGVLSSEENRIATARRYLDSAELWLRRLIEYEFTKRYGSDYFRDGVIKSSIRSSVEKWKAATPGRFARDIDATSFEQLIEIATNHDNFKNVLSPALINAFLWAQSI